VQKQLEAADDSIAATPAGDALLAKLNVQPIEQNRKTPEAPQDAKLLAALTDAGADWDMGAGHGHMTLDITCVIADATCAFANTSSAMPPMSAASGKQAKALAAALQAAGIKPNGPKLAAHVECETMDEGFPDGLTPGDSCDVKPR
jgi:hypothetical protein